MALIQWYPGHMAKAKREVQEKLKYVDVVIELRDARIPVSSKNPMIEQIIKNKKHLILLNKNDLADSTQTNRWLEELTDETTWAIGINSKNQKEMKRIRQTLTDFTADTRQKWADKGVKNRSIRIMILGIPNVGKSTFINQLTKHKKAEVGNRPGVTKGQQWIRIDSDFELLDTPGILWPKFEDETVGTKLALTGAIKDTHYFKDDIALFAIEFLMQHYPKAIGHTYPVKTEDMKPPYPELLMAITKAMNFQDDYERASEKLIYDFREGTLGHFTIDPVQDYIAYKEEK